jgi:hypothetical protein
MIIRTAGSRPSQAARDFGYTVAAVLNLVLLYLINVRPGWRVMPVLTEDTTRVLVVLNLSLAAGIVANLLYVLHDPPRWKALGELVTNSISLVVLFRIWAVFPFAFDAPEWTLIARTVLVIAIAGTGIAMLVQAVSAAGAAGRSVSGHA